MCIFLDFVPIKRAIYIEDTENLKSDEYICSFTQVTGGNWEVESPSSDYGTNQLFFEDLIGNGPLDYLDKNFSTDYLEPSGNRYLFSGTVIPKEDGIYDFKIKKWHIVYPIQRKSIRMLYAPKGYLTIYDYNWIKILER